MSWFTDLFKRDRDLERFRLATAYVNRNCRYKADPGWQLKELQAGETGDCDSFAVTIYRQLRLYGVPEEQMAVVAYKHWTGQDHAVLQAKSRDTGKVFYLDGVYNNVLSSPPTSPILATLPPAVWPAVKQQAARKKAPLYP